MADALRLLFELDADGRLAVGEFKRVRAAFATELEGIKKLAATVVKLNVEGNPAGPGIERERLRIITQNGKAIEGLAKREVAARLREEQRAAREVARIRAETTRQADRQERIREQAAKRLADAQIREAKRAARELERSLGVGRGGGGFGDGDIAGGIASITGSLPVLGRLTSQFSNVSAGAAAAGGAIGGLATPIGIAVVAITAQIAAVAGLTIGLTNLAKRTAEYQGNLLDLSQQLGISVETLSAFEVLAKTTGGSLDSVAGALGIFQKNLEDTRDPTSEESKLLKELGVTARDTETALQQTLAGLFALGDGAKQTDATLTLFGRSGRFVNAILKESGGDLEKAKQRFRELGIEISTGSARAADQLNDSLAELDFETRAAAAVLVADLIPALTEMVRTTGDLLTILRPLTSFLGTTVGTTARTAAESYKGLGLVIATLTGDYKALTKAIKESREAQQIPVVNVPAPTPAPLPGTPSQQQKALDVKSQADVLVANAKRVQAEASQALDTLFQQGRRNRAQQAEETIAQNKKVLDAEVERIEATIGLKQKEFQALEEEKRKRGEQFNTDTQEYRAATEAITKLQQERLDKENEFRVQSAAMRARVANENANARRSQIDSDTNILLKEFDRQIIATQAAIARGAQVESEGVVIIEALERAKIDARRKSLEDQKKIGFLTVQESENINDQIKALNQEADRLEDEQRQRRLARERATAERTRDIKIGELETTLELQRIIGERIITSTRVLADARVKTEEQAAREILRVRLTLVDEEITATEAKLKAASSISNVDERTRAEAELNNQLKILKEQRKTIQADGNRDVDEGRQKDLDSARRYADDLKAIQREIADAFRDNQQLIIDLLTKRNAPASAVLAKRVALERADEEARHKRVVEDIARQRRENAESNRTQEEKNEKTAELNRRAEVEEERHRLELQKIRDDETRGLEKLDPNSTRSLFGDTFANFGDALRETAAAAEVAISNLTVILGSFGAAAAEHFANASAQAGNFISILLDGVDQITAGLGDMLQNWVLLGETGSAAFRKLLASTLAYYAKTFLIKALDNVAEGFSNLAKAAAAAAAFNPVSAALYKAAAVQNFISAAKYGIASAGTAVAGRLAAGDSFKQDTARRAVNGGEDAEPRNANFNLGGPGVESASRAAREGSGGILGPLVARIEQLQQQNLDLQRQQQLQNAQVAQALTKLGTARPGDVVTVGAQERPDSIAVAVIQQAGSNGDFKENLQRGLGFA